MSIAGIVLLILAFIASGVAAWVRHRYPDWWQMHNYKLVWPSIVIAAMALFLADELTVDPSYIWDRFNRR